MLLHFFFSEKVHGIEFTLREMFRLFRILFSASNHTLKEIKDFKLTLKRVSGIDKLERRGLYQRDIAATFLGHSTLEQPIVSL